MDRKSFELLSIIALSNLISLSRSDQAEYKFTKLDIKKSNTFSFEGKPQWHAESLSKCCTLCGCDLNCHGVHYRRHDSICVKADNNSDIVLPFDGDWRFYSRTIFSDTDMKVDPFKLYTDIPQSTTNIYDYASESCDRDGRHLVQLRNEEEHTAVKNFVDSALRTMTDPVPQLLFIFIDGLLGDDYSWYFSDGNPMPYLDWAPNQPNNFKWSTYGNQSFLTLNQNSGYKMNDYWNFIFGDDTVWYLCEF